MNNPIGNVLPISTILYSVCKIKRMLAVTIKRQSICKRRQPDIYSITNFWKLESGTEKIPKECLYNKKKIKKNSYWIISTNI